MKMLGPLFVLACLGFIIYLVLDAAPEAFQSSGSGGTTPQQAVSGTLQPVMQQAAEANKPVLLVFTASWCGPCQQMKKRVYPSHEVQAIAHRYVWAVLDIDDRNNQSVSQKYNIRGIPAYVILSPDGKTLARRSGGASPRDFSAWLAQYAN